MTFRVIAEPELMAVSLGDARNAARINGADSDAEIDIQVRAVTATAEHLTGRAIIERAYRGSFDAFPDLIVLPASPAASVTSVKYFDLAGDEQTLAPGEYILDVDSEPARIVPLASWPDTQARPGAVVVDVVCGYGLTDASTPAPFKAYILAKVREHFAPAGTPPSPYIDALLDQFKVY